MLFNIFATSSVVDMYGVPKEMKYGEFYRILKDESSSIKRISVFPESVGTNGNKANIFYFIVPSDIEWAFTTGSLGQYEYDANNSVQFLLTEDEFTNIVKRILLYSGIIVRDPQIVQAAAAQIQKEEVQEKS